MKKSLFAIVLLCVTSFAFAGEINLSGIYQGKNVNVYNPFASTGVGFCVYEVQVNDGVTTDEVNASAFEIDLSVYGFKIGSEVRITIKHKGNCRPKVLNPEVLRAKSTYRISSMKVGRDMILRWTTSGESGSLPFIVEQYRWNKWVKIGVVKGKGTPGSNSYELPVEPHSGENEFRVKQVDYSKTPNYSRSVKYRNYDPEVSYVPEKKVSTSITFSRETAYEVYDPYGQLIEKGFGKTVDVSALKAYKKMLYTLLYDNKIAQFEKK